MEHKMVLIYILFVHWIADFVCQSDWMAKNKSSNNRALLYHVFAYGMVLLILTIPLLNNFSNINLWCFWIFMNIALHFITDYITSRITKKLWEAGRVHDFFVMVGFDQLIHHATLFLTYMYLANGSVK